jgi:hypothetical protein
MSAAREPGAAETQHWWKRDSRRPGNRQLLWREVIVMMSVIAVCLAVGLTYNVALLITFGAVCIPWFLRDVWYLWHHRGIDPTVGVRESRPVERGSANDR